MNHQSIQSTLEHLDERAVQVINQYALSGLAIGVIQDSHLVYAKGFGLADARTGRPVTPDTSFRIASISKTFTAIAVMQLWEQGKVGLDDPVNQHLKSYKVLHRDPFAPPVTIRHMLTHTSGIGEVPKVWVGIKEMITNKPDPLLRPGDPIPPLGEYYEGCLEPEIYPGQKWAYANHAFGTLGQLIEDVSGEPFPEYMCRHVFEPLGMTKSDFLYSEKVKDTLATGYAFKKGRLQPVDFYMFPDLAAGSVFSSVNEMAKYAAALMNGGANENGRVLKPETLQMMHTPHYQADPHLGGMGLGFFWEDLDGHPAVWHGGALDGFNSSLWVAPQDRLAVVVFANTPTRMIYAVGQNILRDLLGLPDVNKRLPIPGIMESPHTWGELIGSYGPLKGFNTNARAWLNYGDNIDVIVRGNHLVLKSLSGALKGGMTLYPVDPANPLIFENVTDGKITKVAFQRNAEGYVDRFSLDALSYFTFYKQPVTQSVRFKALAIAGALLAGITGITLVSVGKRRKHGRRCC